MIGALRLFAVGFPPAALAAFFTTWVAARLCLGHWPRPYFDDPKALGVWVDIPYELTGLFLNIGLPTFPFAIIILFCIALRKREQRTSLAGTAAVALLLAGIAIAFLRWDPLHIADWYFD